MSVARCGGGAAVTKRDRADCATFADFSVNKDLGFRADLR